MCDAGFGRRVQRMRRRSGSLRSAGVGFLVVDGRDRRRVHSPCTVVPRSGLPRRAAGGTLGLKQGVITTKKLQWKGWWTGASGHLYQAHAGGREALPVARSYTSTSSSTKRALPPVRANEWMT